MNKIVPLLLVASLAGCGNPTQSDRHQATTPLASITHSPENASYINLRLSDRTDGDTTVSFAARGLYNTDTVGFIVEVAKQIPAGVGSDGQVDEKAGFRTGSIRFIRSGAESDRFVAALAELWGVDSASSMDAQPIQPLVFSSNRIPVDLDKSYTYSFKLFFAADAPVPGEVFFTLDTYRRTIEFQEKGTEYRSQIVRAFTE